MASACAVPHGLGRAGAAQVHRRDPVPGVGERADLVAPGPPELREAVQQHDKWALADLGHVKAGAVGGDESMLPGSLDEHG